METLQGVSVGVVGAGNIGRILLERLRAAGVEAGRLAVYDAEPSRARADKVIQLEAKLASAVTA